MNFTPIQTEYSGVVFRSKCEAMFARCLDLAGFWWEYEPKSMELSDGWVPDFEAVSKQADHSLHHMLIEYKPDDVTDSFLEKYKLRINELLDENKIILNTSAIVVCGSFFNKTRILYGLPSTNGTWERQPLAKCWSEFMSDSSTYRFDLKQHA